MLFTDVQRSVRLNKMKSLSVWHGHSTRPSLPAGTARKDSGSFPHGRRSRLIILPTKRNRAFPTGNALLYRSLLSVAFGRVRPVGHALFFTTLHRFLRAASGIRHQHGSGSDAAHPGIVPVFCAGMPYKHARRQCHFPAYCPILSA